jgi:hypothetical protein
MEQRAEPRFPVRSPIRVIVPGDPTRILDCDLIDVSATGMRFLSGEPVPADEIVAIEVDSRLVLAEIRYCQTRGDKFVAGVHRLQEIAKGAELKDSAACATEMIRDLRRHISAGGEPDPKALAMNALQKIVARSEISSDGPEASKFELLPPEPVQPQPLVFRPSGNRGETSAITIPNARELDAAPRLEPTGATPIDEMRLGEPVVAESPAAAPIPKAPIIALAPTGSGVPARASRSWRVPGAIAAALILACAITVLLMQRRSQASSLAPPAEIQTAAVAPSPAPAQPVTPDAQPAAPEAQAAPAVPPASIPSPEPPPAKKAGAHHARIKIIETSWVTLVVDGGQPLQTMLYKGDVHDFDYSQKAFLRVGNAAGVEITLDGTPIGPLKGKVLLLQFTPQGVKYQ